jgi:hypothetical protein
LIYILPPVWFNEQFLRHHPMALLHPGRVAMAREGYDYRLNWPKHLESRDDRGLTAYRNTGALVVKTDTHQCVCDHSRGYDNGSDAGVFAQ